LTWKRKRVNFWYTCFNELKLSGFIPGSANQKLFREIRDPSIGSCYYIGSVSNNVFFSWFCQKTNQRQRNNSSSNNNNSNSNSNNNNSNRCNNRCNKYNNKYNNNLDSWYIFLLLSLHSIALLHVICYSSFTWNFIYLLQCHVPTTWNKLISIFRTGIKLRGGQRYLNSLNCS